jgi:DNA polymerase III subunit delta
MTPPRPEAAAPQEPPAGLTLLVGTEGFLVARGIRRVLRAARAVDPAVERREVDAVDPAAVGELQSALSPSLFAESAVVIVRGVDEASETLLGVLLDGVSDLAERMWVVVEHSGSKARTAVAGLAALRGLRIPGGVREIACAEVKRGRETRDFLMNEARAAGRRLTGDGADALAMALGSDTGLLVGALEQLLADSPEPTIDASVVTTMFAGVGEVSGFQLADAVWEGRGRLALQRLRWGTASQDISPAGAVGSLASGLRGMVRVGAARRGLPDAEVARAAGVPPFKVRLLREAFGDWAPRELGDAVVRLAEVDAAVKGGLRPGESLESAQKGHVLEAFVTRTTGLLGERPSAVPGSGAT